MTQNEVNWVKFIEIYIFGGRYADILQRKTIQKPNKTNITSLLHVLLSKLTQNGVNYLKFFEI
jgi:hypothetical protein